MSTKEAAKVMKRLHDAAQALSAAMDGDASSIDQINEQIAERRRANEALKVELGNSKTALEVLSRRFP